MEIVWIVADFFSDLTNAGMVLEAMGVALVAVFGIPRNNDASTEDTVVVKKTGDALEKARQMLRAYTRRERLGFLSMGIGIILMLIDRNL
ncbi:hypothetical protein [Halomonas stenophila]|uniref:Class 3 adenylate cyclase n=1 Tax=Halomonas stenophila TaxID=795312 RepID=A0A7W5EUK1_9GAMM|nr:hypothetical protein [Halomonas stenophila]MBB3231722.1 class 3 adenylate cyclase [Halomonas stenophila]